MDALAGYGSDSENDHEIMQPVLAATSPELERQPQQPGHLQSNQGHLSSHQSQPRATVKLPSAELLLSGLSGANQHAPSAAGSKRPFTAVIGHSLPHHATQAKSSKDRHGGKPGQATATGKTRGMLLPPQLSGRSNVVTEDLDKLFTKKSNTASQTNQSQQ